MNLPTLPCSFETFPSYLQSATTQKAVTEALGPFLDYEAKLRQIFAQEPNHPAVSEDHLVPVFRDGVSNFTIRARDLDAESPAEKEKYLLPLSKKQRRENGAHAAATTLKEFQNNFALFSEQALADLKWDNVVVSGSGVLTALLPVEAPHNASKRALRSYYHEQLAPASDVDLFLYGLTEEQAIEKIKEIETSIKDSILSEVTVVRTKNAITIVSEYPIRHIQIVLRLYKSITEILTGFDVDCACAAYDGKQVWAAPRALAALCTQVNSIDLTRRSPSYENRLSKYAHRGFEVHCPTLDRSRIDPTIFERAFNRVQGLARLLVLEKLPHPQDRLDYSKQRRSERGRPELPWNYGVVNKLPGNVKDAQPDDVPDWQEEDQESNYHTFTLPWGPKYGPKRVERLLYAKDLLLNAEWNKPDDRETNLHRHPAFFGTVKDVMQDCCGYCPKPVTDEDLTAWEQESKTFITGSITFLKDDPGRQAIGSFHPLTDDDWTTMAYVGNTTVLCQAIVAQDLESVLDWLKGGDADVTRRDHTGRTPLQLAVTCSSEEIVRCLVDHGARINARLYNGFTALHLAAHRGNAAIIKTLMDKSAENEREEEKKEETRKAARREKIGNEQEAEINSQQKDEAKDDNDPHDASNSDSDFVEEMDVDSESSDQGEHEADDMTEGSFVKVGTEKEFETEDDPDGPDVLDISVVAWDAAVSPLHLAIMAGHENIIRLLIDEYGADPLLPVKIMDDSTPRRPLAAILSLTLPMALPPQRAVSVVKLLLEKGASPLQADMKEVTALHYMIAEDRLDLFKAFQEVTSSANISKAIDHLLYRPGWYNAKIQTPLLSAIRTGSRDTINTVVDLSKHVTIDFDVFVRKCDDQARQRYNDEAEMRKFYQRSVEQPITLAARQECTIDIIPSLVDRGADVNSLTREAWEKVHDANRRSWSQGESVLDSIRFLRTRLENFSTGDFVRQLPEPLNEDTFYLEGIQQNTYQQFSALGDLERAKFIQDEGLQMFYSNRKKIEEEEMSSGRRAKKSAAADLAVKFKTVEAMLMEKGAKGFEELYPHLKQKEDDDSQPAGDETRYAYGTKFAFDDLGISSTDHPLYIQLFEAAYSGDIDTLKDLCISKDETRAPLKIAISDDNGFNCFNLAVLRGHYDLAGVVLEIAAAQHRKKDTERKKYSLHPVDSLDDDATDEDEFGNVFGQLVDDKFTIEDIYEISRSVKSKKGPLDMLNQTCDLVRMIDAPRKVALRKLGLDSEIDTDAWIDSALDIWIPSMQRVPTSQERKPWKKFKDMVAREKQRTRMSLWTYATHTNNVQLLNFLFKMEKAFSVSPPEEILSPSEDLTYEFEAALDQGHMSIVSSIISHQGILLPLDHLAEKSGTKIVETPKYYQGLSVYGEKRQDWAQQNQKAVRSRQDSGSPILQAILHGNLDMIEFFMSTQLADRYETFAKSHDKDQRIRSLANSSGGIPTAIQSWMNSRMDLALHMAVLSKPSRTINHLEYLLERMPKGYLENKCCSGHTPLHLAMKIGNLPAFERLLAAGADQRTKDWSGQNLLHTFCTDTPGVQTRLFKMIIEMLDDDVVQDLLLEKCQSTQPASLTPFALRLHREGGDNENDLGMFDLMLELTDGKLLNIMDGAGDYPLHYETRHNHIVKATYFAKKQPHLLYQENATGMTPIEVAHTAYLQHRIRWTPELSDACNEESILDKPDNEFALDEQPDDSSMEVDMTEDDDLPTMYPIYAALVRIARAHPQPRQLISVLDANEVARRLAARQNRDNAQARRDEARGLSTNWRGTDQAEPKTYHSTTDEVDLNYQKAQNRISEVPWLQHVGDSMEDFREAYQKWCDFASGKIANFKCCDLADDEDKGKREGHRLMLA